MDAWRRRFTRNLLLVTGALQVPFGLLVADLLARATGAALAAAAAVALIVVLHLPLVWRLVHYREDRRSHALHVWAADVPFFLHFCASLLFAPLAYLALVGAGLAHLAGAPAPPPARYLGPLYALGLAVSAYASLVRRFWTVVRHVTVEVDGLPAALDGYVLVQLSDVHCGPYMPRWQYRALARRACALGPDAVVLTGDMISSGVGYLDDVRDLCARLRAPDGVFACMGNHDYFGTDDGVADAMRAGGAVVLRNAGAVVAAGRGGGFYLAAVDDNWSRRDDLPAALTARPAGLRCVLLAHDPGLFARVADRGDVDLVLSGHTHAGQFAVPFAVRRWNLARVTGRLTSGTYRAGTTTLYVHAGNGTSGPPARLGAAPEIARVVLRRAPARD